jgi:hypothetical protein
MDITLKFMYRTSEYRRLRLIFTTLSCRQIVERFRIIISPIVIITTTIIHQQPLLLICRKHLLTRRMLPWLCRVCFITIKPPVDTTPLISSHNNMFRIIEEHHGAVLLRPDTINRQGQIILLRDSLYGTDPIPA